MANKFDAVIQFRRAMYAAQASGLAATTAGASLPGVGEQVNHAVEHIQNQVADTVENRLEQELENAIGAPDLDSQQNENSLTGIRSSTMMMGLMKPLKNSMVSFIANARSMVATNQLKIVTGNLQINASLTVVFSFHGHLFTRNFLKC